MANGSPLFCDSGWRIILRLFDYGFQCTTSEEFIALYRYFLVDGMRKKLTLHGTVSFPFISSINVTWMMVCVCLCHRMNTNHYTLADLGGAWGTHAPPWASKFFRFHAVFGKIWRVHAPPGGFTPPPRENPGSATAILLRETINIYTGMPNKELKWCDVFPLGIHNSLQKWNMKHASILKKCLEDSCTSALDFVLSLLLVASKRGRTPSFPCYVSCARWIPQINLWVHHLLTSCRSACWVDSFPHFLTTRIRSFREGNIFSHVCSKRGDRSHGTPTTWNCSNLFTWDLSLLHRTSP